MDGAFVMSQESLKNLCRDLKLYSSCPQLNDVIHLHQKVGITKIQALEEYIGLRTIYLECNAISNLDGLAPLINLRCLYLNQNCIEHIVGLESLQQLEIIDLADNLIRKVKGLSCLPFLRQLNLSGNSICCMNDVIHLKECKSLKSLDISKNRIDNEDALDVLRSIPLCLLRMTGNQVLSVIHYYRKQTIAKMPTLHYLDESPIFDKERRLAIAFVEGGLEAEKDMRNIIANEEATTRDRHRKAFEDIQIKAKKDHVEKLLRQEQLERLKFEETQKDKIKRVERQRLEQEFEVAKQKSMGIEIKTNVDIKYKDLCNDKNEIKLQTLGKEDINFVDMVSRLEGDGKKRGARDLDNEEKQDEYPQKSLKCQNDEIHFESSFLCDETIESMELDDNQQEWFKTTYKENLQRNDVKNIAINRFLEAMSKQDQPNIQNENVCHVEEPTKINGQTHLQDLVRQLTNEISIELCGNNDTTPINTNMITTDDIEEHIITNTLITIHDQCQSHEQGVSSLLHSNDEVTGWKFRQDLQDGLMMKEVANVEKRDVQVAEVNGTKDKSNAQSIRPMIWGTCKYRDLWAKAITIDDDTHMDNASPISMDRVMEIELNN